MHHFIQIFLVGIFGMVHGQSPEFPIDEQGRYMFTAVVELPGMKEEIIFKNGEQFMKKIKVLNSVTKHLQRDKNNLTIRNKGSFYVYRIGAVKNAIDGAVEYDIALDVKDGKYRYTITNYRYNPYERNRFGTYEPVKGKYIPLEADMTTLNQKEWERHRQVVLDKTQDLINNLYGSMIYTETKKSKKVKKEENW